MQRLWAANYVTIIANNLDVGSLKLDGVAVPPASFSQIPGGLFSAAIMPLGTGSHQTSSTNPHGITVEGYNNYDSYSYPGGALFQFINPVGDANPPICTLNPGNPPPSLVGVATDNRPSEDVNNNGVLDPGEDLNGNGQIDKDTGIFFVQLQPGAVNLTLTVAPFVPGDGAVNFTITLTNPNQSGSGVLVVTDGAGNTCQSLISLSAGHQPPVIRCSSTKTASSTIYTVSATDDTDPPASLKIYISDSASPFVAGPFASGSVIAVRTNPTQPPTTRSMTGSVNWFVQLKGQPLFSAQDTAGANSTPKTCGSQP